MSIQRCLVLIAVLALFVVSVGCGATSTGEGGGAAAAQSDAAQIPAGKVSANNASEAELEEAFAAAGIENAEQWAHEVEEYRPYPADDPEFTKLRGDLAKYNPGPGVLDAIVAVLALP